MARRENESKPAKSRISLSSGEVIRMLRELKEWTQEELAESSGISSTNLSALENDRVDIGKRRAACACIRRSPRDHHVS
jgi:DNA-binding XRE family transcriptional regulator